MKKYSKEERSWVLYDVANSAYALIISAAVFPIFYKSVAASAGVSNDDSTAYLGYTIGFATFILALLSPILGTIADYRGLKKKFFSFFFILGTLSTAALAFIPSEQWILLLACYTITAIGFSGANVFYDAFLVDVSSEERMNEVSARGFGFGYIGGTIPFVVSIALILLAQKEMLPFSDAIASKISFVITAVWWGLFTIPMLKNVYQKYYIEREPNPIGKSFKRLSQTFSDIRKYRTLFLFLIAYFFYIDGVGTIIKMSTAYGTDLGIKSESLLIILFLTQIIAAPFTILFGKLAKKYSEKKMLYVGIIIYIIVCVYAFFIKSVLDFWILAMLVGTSQGGIQSLSRSYYAQMVPKEKSNEFFGFYNIIGKFAAVMGPVLMGITTQITGNSSYGVFSLVVLFIIGIFILVRVPNPKEDASVEIN